MVVETLRRKTVIWALAGLAIAVLLVAVHLWAGSLPLTVASPLTVLDRLFDMLLTGAVLALGGALGGRVVRWLRLDSASRLETAVFSCAIGWGILAYLVMALGFLGLLTGWAVLIALVALTLWLRRDLLGLLVRARGWWAERRTLPRPTDLSGRILALLCGLFLLVALMEALAPPSAYDALLYHLTVPRRWALEGRMGPVLDIVQGNYPATGEMLYLLGLLAGSDRLAQLVHLAFGAVGALGALALGRRFFGPTAGWVAGVTVLSIPTIYFLLGTAYVDLIWVAYEFLALYALTVWGMREKSRGWLVVAGLCCGWALGTKYLALYTVGLLGLALLYLGLAGRSWGRKELKHILGAALLFGGIAVLVAAPWYAKNLLWLGNPVYPYFIGGVGWDPDRVQRLAYRGSLHGGLRSWLDYLTLPLGLYLHSERFSQVMFGFPSFLFWLIPLGIIAVWRQPIVRFLVVLALARLVLWAALAPTHVLEIRYYLSFYPVLAVLTGASLVPVSAVVRRWLRRDLLGLLAVGYVLVMFYLQVYVFLGLNPLPTVLGFEPPREYLRRTVVNASALDYVNEQLPASSVVVFFGEAQTYYCRPTCIPDSADDLLSYLIYSQQTPGGILAWMRERGVTHVLARQTHLIWNPRSDVGWMPAADFAVFEAFRARYLVSVYSDNASAVFVVRYPP